MNILNNISDFISGLYTQYGPIIYKYIYFMIGGILSFLTPTYPYIGIMVFMVIFDTYWGVKAAKKEGKRIKSTILSAGILSKMILYTLAIILIFVVNVYIIIPQFGTKLLVMNVSVLFLIFLELQSIDEKMIIVGGKKKGLWFRLFTFFKKTKQIIKTVKEINKDTDEINKNTDEENV